MEILRASILTRADLPELLGDLELLEANITCHEILPRRGESYGEAAGEFHAEFP